MDPMGLHFFHRHRVQGHDMRSGGITAYYCPQRGCGKVIFSQAFVKNSVHGGACVAGGGGMCGRGACMAGGV